VLLVAFVPMVAATTINTIGLAVLASALMLYGGTRLLLLTGAGFGVVLLELESAWNKHHLTIAIAAALCGLALLAAFELQTWAEELARTPSDREAYRTKARQLGLRIGTIAAVLAALIVVAHGFAHGPVLGIAGGLAALGLGIGAIWLSARPGGTP
jgi:hypothetical protein